MRLIITMDFPDVDGTKDDPHEVADLVLDGALPSFTPGQEVDLAKVVSFEVGPLSRAILVSAEWAS